MQAQRFQKRAGTDSIKLLSNIAEKKNPHHERIGMTETAPSCAFTTGPRVMAGFIGYPAPGCEIKLVPCGDKLEFCVRGKHVMKGYWRLKADQQSTILMMKAFPYRRCRSFSRHQ